MSAERAFPRQDVSRHSHAHADGARAYATAERAEDALLALPSPRSLLAGLSLAALALFALSELRIALDTTNALLLRFDTANEANVATWFSSAMWLVAGTLACTIGAAGRRLRDPGANRWLVLGAVFTLLAIDETGQLHEVTVGPLMDTIKTVSGLGHGPARVAAVGFVGLVLVAFATWLWPWLWRLPRALRSQLVLAGAVFVGGSVGLEVVSRLYESRQLSPFEELAEMLGVALLLTSLLPYVSGAVARPAVAPAATD